MTRPLDNSVFDFDDGFTPDIEQKDTSTFNFDDGFTPDVETNEHPSSDTQDSSFANNAADMGSTLTSMPKINGQIARGVAGGIGDTANLIPMAVGGINKGLSYVLPDEMAEAANSVGDELLSVDLGGKIRNWIDDITDNKYKPQSTTDKIIDTASGFLAPTGIIGAVGKGAKAGTTAYKIAKATPAAIGGATALEITKGEHFLPEEIPARDIIEDVLKTTIGAALPGAAAKTFNSVKKTTQNLLTKSASENNKQIFAYAKKEGINLPYHVATDNDASKFLANNLFQSYFISSSWKDIVKNADQSMIDGVRNNINKVSKNIVTKESASEAFKGGAQNVFKELKDKADILYKPAIAAGKKEIISNSSDKLQPLRKVLDEIKEKFNPSKTSVDSGSKFVYDKAVSIEKTLLSQKKISVDTLFNQRSSLLKDSNYGKAEGSKAWLGYITNGIEDSLEGIATSSSNTNFKELYTTAQAFYKNEYIARVKSTMSKALVKGDVPKEAYSFMNSVANIKQLEKIIGNNVKTKPIIQDLKRAKLQEILIDKVFDNAGTLSHANLVTLFDKKSTSQGILKELLGAESYKSMRRLSTLSSRFVKTGRAYANPSKSSHTAKDKFIAHGLSGGLGFGALGAKTLGATLVTPYILSKTLSNKKLTDMLVKASIKANKGESIKRDLHLIESAIVGLNNDSQ